MWVYALAIAVIVYAFTLTICIQVSRTLRQKLHALQRSLVVVFPGLVVAGVAYAVQARAVKPGMNALRAEPMAAAWYEAVGDAQQSTSILMVGTLIVLALTALQVAMVVAELRRFVLSQEADLVARDQIALHAANEKAVAKTAS